MSDDLASLLGHDGQRSWVVFAQRVYQRGDYVSVVAEGPPMDFPYRDAVLGPLSTKIHGTGP